MLISTLNCTPKLLSRLYFKMMSEEDVFFEPLRLLNVDASLPFLDF